jgi:hypothetical protein
MKPTILSLRFWSLAQVAAHRIGTALIALSARCQRRATAANLKTISRITARR